MSNPHARRRYLWYALWLGGGLWLVRVAILPALVRAARLTGISGAGPTYATITWSYGYGARPISVIFDLEAGEVTGSITTDGDALEAEIPLGAPPSGPYQLTASATYRILGVARTIVRRFAGETP
ncbi:MAG: hypothetical protein HXY37_17220 [Chloroflexi bacterium]|nr:hypothetical protein [Chloroflexota bacterium]